MSATFASDNQFTTPPSTPRRVFTDEAYFPPRSHLVGLGLDFAFPSQSTIIGLEQCSAPRLGSFSSPANSSCQGNNQMRCASYWSSDSSLSSRSMVAHSGNGNDNDDNTFSPSNRSDFAYSPFANAMSPSPRASDALSSQVFGLGLALDLEDEEAEQSYIQNHFEGVQTSSYAFQCLASGLEEDGEVENHERLSTTSSSSSCSPMFGFTPAPSYSYALNHPELSLLPSVTIEKDVSSSSTSISSVTKVGNENATGILPLVDYDLSNLNDKDVGLDGENDQQKKRKRKESTMNSRSSRGRRPYQESENVKRLKTSPALRHLSIFTHAAMMEDKDRAQKTSRTMDALSGLCLDITGSREEYDFPTTPALPSIVFEDSPETTCQMTLPKVGATNSPSRTIDCTLLVSNIPSESPYPPTPSSSAFTPFLYTSTIDSMESPSSNTFKEEIKKDICSKLALESLGMGIQDVNVFTASAPVPSSTENCAVSVQSRPRTAMRTICGPTLRSSSCEANSGRTGMVVVVHTA